ncbi:MAG: hypothetical protein AAF604_18545 [Acidobacteriota bacterium]
MLHALPSPRFLALILLTTLLALPVAAAPATEDVAHGPLEQVVSWLEEAWNGVVSALLPGQQPSSDHPAQRTLTQDRGPTMDPNGVAYR